MNSNSDTKIKREQREKLENRLIDFSIQVIDISEKLFTTKAANILCTQLIRCCTSPALNYAEAQSAESPSDFLHKMKICLKELRETMVCLKIILRKPFVIDTEVINPVMIECNELISIFVASIVTASRNTNL